MTILFWLSASLVGYAYLGYPTLLWLYNRLRRRPVSMFDIQPSVSVIVTARNEEDKIRDKIVNTLALDYPADRLEVIVASDASDDRTDEIVAEYANRGARLVRSPQRQGKEYAQGLAIVVARGEILVFTDAAAMLEPDILNALARNFSDPTVGAVSTEDVLVNAAGTSSAEGLYAKYEMWVRRLESGFHSLVGLSGSCFAIRKELCTYWPATLASDFMGALHAARAGYRSVTDPSARCMFAAVVLSEIELARKIRTFERGIAVLMANLDMLNPMRYGRFAFQLASHKLLRFLTPFLLIGTFLASAVLMGEEPFRLLFLTQIGFYSLGVVGCFVSRLQSNRVVQVANYFTIVQWAMALAWFKYMRGHRQVSWEPSKRPRLVVGDPKDIRGRRVSNG